MRIKGEVVKFLVSWIDPAAVSSEKKSFYTWIGFDLGKREPVEPLTNPGEPKNGLYASFIGNRSLGCAIVSLLTDYADAASTSKVRVLQFDPFIDTREVELKAKIWQMYPTPLRNGKALMYFNSGDNLLQLSKNRSEKQSEDDFQIHSNRKYCFQLAYGEQVLDIKWYNYGKPDDSEAKGVEEAGKKENPKAVIATNQRIYIVDKNLSILQNMNLA